MATHHIEPERRTLHGHWSRDLPPVLTVDPGDTVVFRTLDASWAVEPRSSTDWRDAPRTFMPRNPLRDRGHALCGPVAVRGAEPGMTLVVRFGEIRPANWGWTYAGAWMNEIADEIGVDEPGICHLWTIDADAGTATNHLGYAVPIRPFLGVIGLAPDEPGILDTRPPRPMGGNIDCKELVAGSTLYLPIAVPGGLFSLGDGHAAQGDGEVSGFAVECPMDRVEVTFDLLPDLRLDNPRAETPAGRMTLAFDEDLDIAVHTALSGMLDWLQEMEELPRADALALAAVAVDIRVTQIVNGVRGAHAVLPHGAFHRSSEPH